MIRQLAIWAAAAACLALPATGQSTTFTLCGTVSSVTAPPALPPPWDTVVVGDPFRLVYTFNCSATDTDASPTVGFYGGAVSTFTFSAGPGLSISTTQTIGPASADIRVFCNDPVGFDRYESYMQWVAIPDFFSVFFEFTGPNGALSQSPCDALPCCIDPSLFTLTKHLTFYTGFGPFLSKFEGDVVGCSTCHNFSSGCLPGLDGTMACPCSNPPGAVGKGCNNSAGVPSGGARLSGTGTALLSPADSVVFTATGMLSSATCIFMQGSSLAGTGFAFGDGVRCCNGNLKRLYVKTASGGTATAPVSPDPSVHARSAALGDTIATGTSRCYSTYYRDPAAFGCSETFNITQSLVVLWQ